MVVVRKRQPREREKERGAAPAATRARSSSPPCSTTDAVIARRSAAAWCGAAAGVGPSCHVASHNNRRPVMDASLSSASRYGGAGGWSPPVFSLSSSSPLLPSGHTCICLPCSWFGAVVRTVTGGTLRRLRPSGLPSPAFSPSCVLSWPSPHPCSIGPSARPTSDATADWFNGRDCR